MLNQSPARIAWHVLGRLAIIYMAFVLPFRMFPLGKAFFFAMFPFGFHGMIFFGFSQVRSTPLSPSSALSFKCRLHLYLHVQVVVFLFSFSALRFLDLKPPPPLLS